MALLILTPREATRCGGLGPEVRHYAEKVALSERVVVAAYQLLGPQSPWGVQELP